MYQLADFNAYFLLGKLDPNRRRLQTPHEAGKRLEGKEPPLSLPFDTSRIRFIALDLDGTLLRTDKSISTRTRSAVESAESHGYIPIIATALFVRERPMPAKRAGGDAGWRSGMRLMLSNKPYLRILAYYFVNGIANAFPVTLLFFYVKQIIERPDWTAIYLAVYFVAAIAGTPVWMFVAKRLGKHLAWRYALILAIFAFAIVPFLGSGDTIPFLFVAIVAGVTLGADLAMPASMLADVVDQDVLETGRQRTGVFFAVWAMAAKAAAALVVGISLKLLDVVGFVPDMYNDADALLVLAILFGVCPIVFKVLALGAVWRYPLTAARQARLRAEILARQSA